MCWAARAGQGRHPRQTSWGAVQPSMRKRLRCCQSATRRCSQPLQPSWYGLYSLHPMLPHPKSLTDVLWLLCPRAQALVGHVRGGEFCRLGIRARAKACLISCRSTLQPCSRPCLMTIQPAASMPSGQLPFRQAWPHMHKACKQMAIWRSSRCASIALSQLVKKPRWLVMMLFQSMYSSV